MPPDLLLFSDIDGTLLDDDLRAPFEDAAFAIHARGLAVIFTSSRTVAELCWLQQRFGIDDPVIAENGAVIAYEDGWRGLHDGNIAACEGRLLRTIALGAPASEVKRVVSGIAERLGLRVRLLNDFSVAELTGETGGTGDGERALQRTRSVLVFRGAHRAEEWERFREALIAAGLNATLGGRWLAVTGGADKGRAARHLATLLERHDAGRPLLAAIGDAENDLPLLSEVDMPFVINTSLDGHHHALVAVPRARLLREAGTAGWPEAAAILRALLIGDVA